MKFDEITRSDFFVTIEGGFQKGKKWGEVGCEGRWGLRPYNRRAAWHSSNPSLSPCFCPPATPRARFAGRECQKREELMNGLPTKAQPRRPLAVYLLASSSLRNGLPVFSTFLFPFQSGLFLPKFAHFVAFFHTKKLGYQPETHPSFMIFSFNKPGWFQSIFHTIPFQPSFVRTTTTEATRFLKCLVPLFICYHSKVKN
jgi:hypothetical protein